MNEERFQIACGFFDHGATKAVLEAGINIANAIFLRATGTAEAAQAQAAVQGIVSGIPARPLSITTASLTRLAGKRGIPFYSVCRNVRCLFGQGVNGFYFTNMANQEDSITGWRISENKALTSDVLRQLGFPTTEHGIASAIATAIQIGNTLGFPLVVKPSDRGAGLAVTVGITAHDELVSAFGKAKSVSRIGQVVVERFVPGDDHRISVFNGKVMRVTRLTPPKIIGNGNSSVAELIAEKNRSLAKNPAASGFFSQHEIDSEIITALRKQEFGLEDCPVQGAEVLLRNTSNLHTGGKTEDVTALIHPDNVAMAESIAKTIHMDALGIDLITPDIAKPWTEIECAIIEINSNPGVRDEATLEKVLLEKIPAGSDGRIPSILIVDGGLGLADQIVQHVLATSRRVGYTSSGLTHLAGQRRFKKTANLPTRIKSLLLDANCEALIVSCTRDEIAARGLPHTRYDLALIADADPLSDDMFQLIKGSVSQIMECVSEETLHQVVLPRVTTIVSKA